MNFLKNLLSKFSFLKRHTKLLVIGFFVFVIGFIWHFPFNRIKEVIQSQIYAQTRAVVEISTIQPALPIGLKFMSPKVSNIQMGMKQMSFDLDFLKVSVTPWSALTFVLTKSGKVYFSAAKQTFKSSGSVYTGKKNIAADITLKNLKVDDKFAIPSGDPFGGPGMEIGFIGTVEGDITADIDPVAAQKQDFSSLKGTGKLTLASVTLQTPLIGNLEFAKITADIKADKGNIEIKSVSLSGQQITGKGSGTIKIDPFFPQSQLRIDATLTLTENAGQLRSLVQSLGSAIGITMDASGNVALKINGTMAAPIDKGY